MPKCCVPDCDSGSFKEVKRTKAAGLRHKSYFIFPKDEKLLKKWKKIIFHTEDKDTDKLNICEIHFLESDINKYYETLLKDGSTHRIPRGKYSLKKGAIPISTGEEEEHPIKNNMQYKVFIKEKTNDIDVSKASSTENIQEKNNGIEMSETISTKNHLTITKDNQSNNKSFKESQSMSIQACNDNSLKIIQETIVDPCLQSQISNKFTCKGKENTQIKVYKSNRQAHNVQLSTKQSTFLNSNSRLTATQKESKNNNCIPCHEECNDDFNTDMFQNDSGDDSEEDSETAKLTKTIHTEMSSNKEKCIKYYNFRHLENDLQSKYLNISSSWAYAFQENAVTFAYVHPLKQVIQLICIIDSNMNVKLATFNKKVITDVSITFNSSIEFENYLCKLEKTKCCDGIGIKNIFSDNCRGFISSGAEYKRSRGYNRCNPCRKYRKITLKKKNDGLDTELRLQKQIRQTKLLQYKYRLLQKDLSKK